MGIQWVYGCNNMMLHVVGLHQGPWEPGWTCRTWEPVRHTWLLKVKLQDYIRSKSFKPNITQDPWWSLYLIYIYIVYMWYWEGMGYGFWTYQTFTLSNVLNGFFHQPSTSSTSCRHQLLRRHLEGRWKLRINRPHGWFSQMGCHFADDIGTFFWEDGRIMTRELLPSWHFPLVGPPKKRV